MIFAGNNPRDTRNSLILAILFNVMALLLAYLIKMPVPDPPLAEEYAELTLADFGFADTGGGVTETAPVQSTASESAETPEEAIIDTHSEEATNVTETPNTSTQSSETTQVQNQESQETQETQQTTSNALSNAINAMNDGGGDGPDDSNNNQGIESGQIDGKGVFGDGGDSFNLAGRGMTGEPKFRGKPKIAGRVVVKIDVNRTGQVTNATIDKIKSNTSDQDLYDLAKKMALTATFTSDNKNVTQRGSITFNFKVQ